MERIVIKKDDNIVIDETRGFDILNNKNEVIKRFGSLEDARAYVKDNSGKCIRYWEKKKA